MFDAQITVALFAAFLLGMIAGSGMEIIVRGGRHWIRALTTEFDGMLSSRRPETLEQLRSRPCRERRAPSDGLVHSLHDEPVTRGGTTCARQKERRRSPRGAA